eukprot:IDg7332t1
MRELHSPYTSTFEVFGGKIRISTAPDAIHITKKQCKRAFRIVLMTERELSSCRIAVESTFVFLSTSSCTGPGKGLLPGKHKHVYWKLNPWRALLWCDSHFSQFLLFAKLQRRLIDWLPKRFLRQEACQPDLPVMLLD